MSIKFVVQQKLLGLSDSQRLCDTWSRDIEALASRSGWRGLPTEPINVPVGTAINMLVWSIAMSHGVEAIAEWLPGLRNEALLKLGEDTSNWSFDGASEAQQQFLPMLYGSRDAVRSQIAPLLGCCATVTTRQLRFHSQSDVECLSNSQFEQGHSGRTPRFTIDAHALADKMRVTCGAPLFTAKAANFA
jgi:hypothetical protein